MAVTVEKVVVKAKVLGVFDRNSAEEDTSLTHGPLLPIRVRAASHQLLDPASIR